jgi:hypothetical protein
MISPEEIAAVVRAPGTTFEDAARLIQSYAVTFASGEVIKAIEQQHERTMAIITAPLTRRAR